MNNANDWIDCAIAYHQSNTNLLDTVNIVKVIIIAHSAKTPSVNFNGNGRDFKASIGNASMNNA